MVTHFPKYKYFLIIIFYFLFIQLSYSQWHSVNSGTNKNLIDIAFTNDSIGYIVSDSGVVIKTIDQGNNWSIVSTLPGNYTSICSLGRDTIYIGGNNIYRSIDGGNTWLNLINLPYIITDLEFFNSQKAVLIKPQTYNCTSSQGSKNLENYEAFTSLDSGRTWQYSFNYLRSFSRFQLINESTAYVTGGYYHIIDHCNGFYPNINKRTSNEGSTWSDITALGIKFLNFYLLNDSSGYFIGEEYGSGIKLWKMENSINSIVRAMNFSSNQLIFINMIDGYILDGNNIYKTNTKGIVWDLDSIPPNNLNKIFNNNNKNMFAIGSNGTILKKEIIESQNPDTIFRISSSSNSLNFNSVMIGANKVMPTTIINEGNTILNVSVQTSNTFQLSLDNINYYSTISFVLNSLNDTVIYVKFNPSDTLNFIDSLFITGNNLSDLKIPISGYGTKDLAGFISGIVNICQDTIKVIDNLVINNDGKLIICPGTTILFMGNYKFEVYGSIIAFGQQNDSIRFTPQDELIGWGGIQFFNNLLSDTSILKFCIVEFAKKIHLSTYFDGAGIYFLSRSNVILENSTIANNYTTGDGGGIYLYLSSPIISHNKIYNNTSHNGGGIDGFTSSPLILGNVIYNNRTTDYDGAAISISPLNSTTPVKIIQNLIFNNSSARWGGGIRCDGATYLINNTICNNWAPLGYGGVEIACPNSSLILNNIIYNNSINQLSNSTCPLVSYCNIENGFNGGVGNISQPPLFVNPTDSIGFMNQIGNYDWSLTTNSPCIDAGDSTTYSWMPSTDIEGNPRISNRIDIGAYEFQSNLNSINNFENTQTVNVFPIPFDNFLNFSTNNNLISEIIIYDIAMRKLIHQSFVNFLSLNTAPLTNGVYFYEVVNKNGLIKNGIAIKKQ
jgi:hypothetical protein